MLLYTGLIEVFHLERLREILSEEVRRSGLQRFAVAHHCFDGIGNVRAGEFLRVGFFSRDHRNCRVVDREVRVRVEHLPRFVFGFLLGCVRGVALLPIKLQRSQKKFCA